MCKFICSLYETTLRLPHIGSFYSEPELPIEVAKKGFLPLARHTWRAEENRRDGEEAAIPPRWTRSVRYFGLSAWSADAERPPRFSGNKCQ